MSARFTAGEVSEALGVEPAVPPAVERPDAAATSGLRFESVSTDTRTLEPGALFVALRGERYDAMEFLADAAQQGARGAVVRAGEELPDLPLAWFPVEEPRHALGELAARHRRRVDPRVVAVTGSSGKTTVKEMTAAALGGEPEIYRSPGNLNNQVGLPLSILEAPDDAETWVLELGTNAPGEIGRLTEISAPDDAVVVTVGAAHLEGLESLEGVYREKLALLEGADPGGLALVGDVPEELPERAREIRPDVTVAGLSPAADVRPDRHEVGPESVSFRRSGTDFRVEAGGIHHLRDALLAVAVAEARGRPPARIAEGLARFRPLGMRSSLRRAGELLVVADCYNANPDSFRAAVDYLRRAFTGRRRAAVVGTMLELGEHSSREHRRVARWLLSAGFDVVAATGEFVDALEAEAPGPAGLDVVVAGELDALWEALEGRLEGDEVVLVKASRGAGLDVIVERLEATFGSSSSGGSRPGGPPHHPGGGGREGTRPSGRGTSTTPTPGGRS